MEFSDYECPFCRALEDDLQQLVARHAGSVEVVRYEFPLTAVHPHAYLAAIAAECAADQDIYEPYQVLLFQNATRLKDVDWTTLAEEAGVPNLTSFSKCVRLGQTAQLVRADEKTGKELGIRATPTLIINGKLIEGAPSLETLEQLVRTAGGNR